MWFRVQFFVLQFFYKLFTKGDNSSIAECTSRWTREGATMEAFDPPILASVPQAYPASAALCFHFVFQVLKIDCEIGEGTGNIEERFQSISVGKYATSNRMSLKTCIDRCELK